MGGPSGRIPGPLGGDVPFPLWTLLGYLGNLSTDVCDAPDHVPDSKDSDSKDSKVWVTHLEKDVTEALNKIYYSEGGGDYQTGEASNRDPAQAVLPVFREGDSRRDVKKPGISLKSKCFKMNLGDVKWSQDDKTLAVSGDAKGTLEIPTEYPSVIDTPTDIPIHVNLIKVGVNDLTASGYAEAYHLVTARYKLTLHWDSKLLVKKLVQMAKDQSVKVEDVREMLSYMSFDTSATIKAGPVPLSLIKMAAGSLLPLSHPLIGATDDLLPVQIAALPNHRLLMAGGLLVPKGTFFPFITPGVGAHYSWYGTDNGFSVTGAGLAVPNLSNLAGSSVYSYFDTSYSRRVSDSLDLSVGFTYTFSLAGGSTSNDPLQLQVIHAKSQPWLPTSEENLVPDQNLAGHNFMLTVKGKFDWL
jgi:hypothetical protein